MPALIVLNGTNCIATEDDGVTWAVVSELPTSVGAGNNTYGGFSGAYYIQANVGALRSDDGVTWVEAAVHGLGSGTIILYDGSTFVAVRASPNQFSRSTDGGLTWSAPAALPLTPSVAGVIGGLFCLMQASNGSVSTSTDGVSWSFDTGTTQVFPGKTVTSQNRNIIVSVGASGAGSVLGSAFTTNGTSWTNGGVMASSGGLALTGPACSADGSILVVGSNSAKRTVRSTDSAGSWVVGGSTANFQSGSAMWVGSGSTFVLPISSGGLCERSTDGGVSWSIVPNPDSLSIVGASFVLPDGLPTPAEAFWTQRVRAVETL